MSISCDTDFVTGFGFVPDCTHKTKHMLVSASQEQVLDGLHLICNWQSKVLQTIRLCMSSIDQRPRFGFARARRASVFLLCGEPPEEEQKHEGNEEALEEHHCSE